MKIAARKGVMRNAISVVTLAGKGDGLYETVSFFCDDSAVRKFHPVEARGCQGV